MGVKDEDWGRAQVAGSEEKSRESTVSGEKTNKGEPCSLYIFLTS